MHPTAEIDPSEDDREVIRDMLMSACDYSKSKVNDTEVFLKQNRKNMDEETLHETETNIKKYRRYSDSLEDALAKCERTRGRTLKKAFNKKTLSAVKDSIPDKTQFSSLEEILQKNHLA